MRAGEVSFAFDPVHELVMLNVRSWLGFNGPLMAALVVGVAATCAVILHIAVERPLQIRLRGAEGRSQETSGVSTSSARGEPDSGPGNVFHANVGQATGSLSARTERPVCQRRLKIDPLAVGRFDPDQDG